MPKTNRGWTMGSRCKPAAEYDIRVARGLLKEDSANWPKYAIVTTPSAYAAARDQLARAPEGVVFAEWLDSGHQQELSDRLPGGVELVIGLGGGKALDASKFVALDKDAELILVPTILSSGAIIHGHVARWDGYQVVGGVNDWPWVDCQYVLVDSRRGPQGGGPPAHRGAGGHPLPICRAGGVAAEGGAWARAGVRPGAGRTACGAARAHRPFLRRDPGCKRADDRGERGQYRTADQGARQPEVDTQARQAEIILSGSRWRRRTSGPGSTESWWPWER